MDVRRPTIHVTIGELALDGVDLRDPAVAHAVRRALAPAAEQHVLGAATADRTAEAVARAVAQPGQGAP